MPAPSTPSTGRLPERGEPHRAECVSCRHEHACYVLDRPLTTAEGMAWSAVPVCLGCLVRAVDPDARPACLVCPAEGKEARR